MAIELPKDASGACIRLNTTTMYREDGAQFHVSDLFFEAKPYKWFARNGSECIEVGKLYLEVKKEDSLSQLADDLERIADHPGEVICAYFNRESGDCEGCKFENCTCHCTYAFLKDVVERIRNLDGDDK